MGTGARFSNFLVTFRARNQIFKWKYIKNKSASPGKQTSPFCFINLWFFHDRCKTIETSIFNVNGDSLPNRKTGNNFLCDHIYDISSIKRVTSKFYIVVVQQQKERNEQRSVLHRRPFNLFLPFSFLSPFTITPCYFFFLAGGGIINILTRVSLLALAKYVE